MVVKIRKKANVMGEETEITQYFPDGIPLTRDRREKADLLDNELQKKVGSINKEYDLLDETIKKDELKKWRWVGTKIDEIFKSTNNLDQADIDNHAAWSAIGQYFREELKRGVDAKRSGTKKDHYRKCWLVATLPNLDWINSWSGWDAFIDRGEQLVMSNKILPALKNKFADISVGLKPKDYQKIAKMVTERIPSGTDAPTDVDAMSVSEIEKIVETVYNDFIKKK